MDEEKTYPYITEEVLKKYTKEIAKNVNENCDPKGASESALENSKKYTDSVIGNTNLNGITLYKWDGENVIPRTEEEINEERIALPVKIAEIKRKLISLDNLAIRPLRAILAGESTDEDREKLQKLEAEAQKLRDELTKYV